MKKLMFGGFFLISLGVISYYSAHFFSANGAVSAQAKEKNGAPFIEKKLLELEAKSGRRFDFNPFLAALFTNLDQKYISQIQAWATKDSISAYVGALLEKAYVSDRRHVKPQAAAKKLRFEAIVETEGCALLYRSSQEVGLDPTRVWMQGGAAAFKEPEEKLWAVAERGDDTARRTLSRLYKIHLMPPENLIDDVARRLCRILSAYKHLISDIKYITVDEAALSERSGTSIGSTPKFVIYCYQGKRATEDLLAAVYAEFKDFPGCGLVPAFNERVTDCIFFAQGNREDKEDPARQHFFESPAMVYLVPHFTGEIQDYHLRKLWNLGR